MAWGVGRLVCFIRFLCNRFRISASKEADWDGSSTALPLFTATLTGLTAPFPLCRWTKTVFVRLWPCEDFLP